MSVFRPLKKPYTEFIRLLPIQQKKVVFSNFMTRGYGGNPKYIAEELHRKRPDMELVWIGDSKADYPAYIHPVRAWSLRHYYELATAAAYVTNFRSYFGVRKRPQQTYLQTWHGSYALKKVEAEAAGLTEKYIHDAKLDGQMSDGILADSYLQEQNFRKAFWLGEHVEILRFGLPQNDIIYRRRNDLSIRNQISCTLDIPQNSYTILFAPTFRDDFSTDGYQVDLEAVAGAFEEKMHRECVVLVRMHPNARRFASTIQYSSRVKNATEYPDVQELVLGCDALITDYSSMLFDFSHCGKPVFLCALDLEAYQTTRGLADDYFTLPLPLAFTNVQLTENIKAFDEKSYQQKVEQFYQKNPVYDTGRASEQVVDWLLSTMEKKRKRG